jgi:hypothetical protein
MHEYGQRKPETMAYTCNVMCVLTVIGAVIAFFAIGGQSKEAESGGLYSAATPAVNMWPLAVVVLASGLTSAVMWFGRSVLFS